MMIDMVKCARCGKTGLKLKEVTHGIIDGKHGCICKECSSVIMKDAGKPAIVNKPGE